MEMITWCLIALGMVCSIWGWFCLKPTTEPGVLKAIGGMTLAYSLVMFTGAVNVGLVGDYVAIWIASLLGMFAMFGLPAGITLLVGGETKPLSWTWLFMAVIMVFYAVTCPLLGFTADWTILMWLIVILFVALFLFEQVWPALIKLAGAAFIAIAANCVYLIMVRELLPLPA